jgi:probable rRNA maturation factor
MRSIAASEPPKMRAEKLLVIRNRQKVRRINRPLLRRVMLGALDDLAPGRGVELCVHLVSAQEITRLNEHFLQHTGPTDVITFSLSEAADAMDKFTSAHSPLTPALSPSGGKGEGLASLAIKGEIYICVEMAASQAKTFRANWQSEVARYAVHGLLHLLGYDDLEPAKRRVMKRAENRLIRSLRRVFPLGQLAAKPK